MISHKNVYRMFDLGESDTFSLTEKCLLCKLVEKSMPSFPHVIQGGNL